ncbi:MAG: metal ABC transporter solute-binding protein, Zn/Mn family [Bacteroidota bacterium]
MKYILIAITLFFVASCNTENNETKNAVTVSITPQKYFAEQLLPNDYEVNVMVPPGSSPATYEPTPRQLQLLGKSGAYVRIGAIEFEEVWMEKIKDNNPNLEIIHSDKSVDYMKEGKERDPHIWTSPQRVKILVSNMTREFKQLFPEDAATIERNKEKLLLRIDEVDKSINSKLKPYRNRAFIIYHPALAYFAKDYQLEQIAIEHHGKEPSAHDMEHIMKKGTDMNINTVFIQKQFDRQSAMTIAEELNAKVVTINPLSEKWDEAMLDIASKLESSFN